MAALLLSIPRYTLCKANANMRMWAMASWPCWNMFGFKRTPLGRMASKIIKAWSKHAFLLYHVMDKIDIRSTLCYGVYLLHCLVPIITQPLDNKRTLQENLI